MFLHYKNKSKKTCGLTVQFSVGSFCEPKGYEGYMHVAEHFMFVSTKLYSRDELLKKIERNFDYLKADTSRDKVEITCTFHIDNFDEVINILEEMVYNWNCSKENFSEEKEIILEEARDFYSQEENKIFLQTIKQLPIKNKKVPIGKIGELKKITYKDVSKIKKFWSKQINSAHTHAITVGGGLDKKHIQKIKKTFGIKAKKNSQVNKNDNQNFLLNKTSATIWFSGYKNEAYKSLLYRIYYFRWFDNYFEKINFSPFSVLDYWFCTIKSSYLSKKEIAEIGVNIFVSPVSKQEFDFSKKVLMQYLDQIIDSTDLVETLKFLNYQYVIKNIVSSNITASDITKGFKNITYKQFTTFFDNLLT